MCVYTYIIIYIYIYRERDYRYRFAYIYIYIYTCVYVYIYIYIYIYSYIAVICVITYRTQPREEVRSAGRTRRRETLQPDTHEPVHKCRKEPIRFDSFRFRTFDKFIGSVRFGSDKCFPGSMRFGLRFSEASWLGPVRFGSFPRPAPVGSEIKRFGSVRFGQFASVSYSFLK